MRDNGNDILRSNINMWYNMEKRYVQNKES